MFLMGKYLDAWVAPRFKVLGFAIIKDEYPEVESRDEARYFIALRF